MVITHESIPEGSYTLRGFHGEPNATDIDLVLTLANRGNGVCEVTAAKGTLDAETNLLIGLKAIELGFHTLRLHALRGSRVTRWAEYRYSDDQFDYYTVDLQNVIRQAGAKNGLPNT